MNEILENAKFSEIMCENIKNCINFLLDENQGFKILARFKFVEFEQPLPKEFIENFENFILFELANYTFETAQIIGDNLTFDAAFGEENFESEVKIPLFSVVQILVDEDVILINPAKTKRLNNKQVMEMFKKSLT